LTIEEQKMVEAALQRTKEIYEMANAEQDLKIRAAMLLTVSGRKDTQDYLRQLASSNDLRTAIEAQRALYIVGDTEHAAKLVEQGLMSGNKITRGEAAELAGLVGDQEAVPTLLVMVDDRFEGYCCPAAMALARLKNREAIPSMVRILTENDPLKGKAAVFALTRLGGPDVIQRIKDRLDTTKGEMRYRLIVVLYKLGDPLGKTLMIQEAMQTPGEVQTQASLLLAENNVWDGKQYLISRLKRKFNETDANLTFRAKAAGVLLQSNDPNAMTIFQELLGSDSANARKIVCMLIAELGKPRLLNIMQATALNPKLDVSLEACTAAIAVAHKEFRERLVESRQ
jgi:HEAT repeat protein